MATVRNIAIPDASPLWRLWQWARGLDGSHITLPDADLRGKWIIITGGNNGIGREAALRFASWGASIVLGCRLPPLHETHPDVTVADCVTAARAAGHESSKIEWWPCDMSDLSTVEAFSRRWLSTGHALDVLANNAGMGRTVSGKLTNTKDGFEIVHQVNFLAHVYLTMSLLPSIARAEDPRIVCTTSSMQYYGAFDLSNANTTADPRSYSHNKLYFQTWLTELQSRISSVTSLNHITVNGVHPGFVNTGIWAPIQGGADAKPPTLLDRLLNKITSVFAIDPQQGSLAIVRAATAKECAVAKRGGEGGGRYFNRIWPSESMPQATSPVCMQLIWEFVDRELSLKEKGLLHVLNDEGHVDRS